MKTCEVLDWLRTNPHHGPLGYNVLRTKRRAIKLVQALYAAGARQVLVTNVSEPGPDEPGTVADTLLIEPPRGAYYGDFYQALVQLKATEIGPSRQRAGFIRAWWD